MLFREEDYSYSYYTTRKKNVSRILCDAPYRKRVAFKFAYALSFIALFIVFTNEAFCQDASTVQHSLRERYTIGGNAGWSDISVKNGIAFGKGRYGKDSLMLDTNSKRINGDTDMLLSFENNEFRDMRGNYAIKSNSLNICKTAIMGKGAAFSRNRNGGLILSGRDGSFFGTEGRTGSFTIDFYLCPSIVENGEVILTWRSSRSVIDKVLYQYINFTFDNNRLLCTFSNIFSGYDVDEGNVYLQGDAPLTPKKWSHHVITYNDEDGSLMYSCDDTTQDIKFITKTLHESGSIYPALLGTAASVELCPRYTGLIDDFCIMRSYSGIPLDASPRDDESLTQPRYVTSGGRFESMPIMIKSGTTLNAIEAVMENPPQTEVHFFVRSGDNHFKWTSESPAWRLVQPGEEIHGVTGLYFQVACDLYSDGAGDLTPSVSQIDLVYTPLQNPRPPYKVNISKGDESVTLKWTKGTDPDIGGYYIYYGTKSGEYLGKRALEGVSPIDVGQNLSCTLNGLQNGRIYYFAICAYSAKSRKIVGDLSKEVYARPCVSE